MSEKKYTVIGWGIAGATLAWQFYFAGLVCKIIDSGKNDSSRVAAGMVNPIVFKRLTKGWKVDELMPYANKFYSQLEKILGQELLSHKAIVRIFSSIEEQNNWATLEGDGRFSDYLEPAENLNLKYVQAPFGIGKVHSLGHLDVNLFLDASKAYLSNNGFEFIQAQFDYQLVHSNEEIIFCDGRQLTENPFFDYIPMKPAHGDVLTIYAPDLDYDDILNKNMFILPIGNDHYKIGATYNWDQKEAVPTEAGRRELEERLTSFCSFDYKIVSHQGGIRPTVADRRPILGSHPVEKRVHLFNGLGTKGVSIAPFYSAQMFHYLTEHGGIETEVDVTRFEKHFNA